MVRRFLIVLVLLSVSAQGATRYVTDRAGGPVQWVEWGPGALQRAVREKRPLFVSIGFAASFDCQRMHREAFLNGENAEALNAYFVPVLLDRIEHPEVAEALEVVLRSMNGATGWPANLVLAPTLEPFGGGGYMTSAELSRLLVVSANRWASDRDAAIAEGRTILNKARFEGEPRAPLDVDTTSMDAVAADVSRGYTKNKTLDAMSVAFLLRYAGRTNAENLRTLAVDSLLELAATSQRDQLGGGFHRCPGCFEKMLPDQALYGLAYLEAWQITKQPDLERVARTTFDYVLRDLRIQRSMFDSAQDAHSLVPGQGPVFVNGAFYLWDKDEITHLLGRDAAGKVFRLYDMKEGVLNLPALKDPRFLHESYDELAAPLAKMLEVRQKRPAPFREAGMAGWNGLMISTLARASAALGEQAYLDAASQAAGVVAAKLWDAQKKTLYRSEGHSEALAEDYAMLVQGLLDLFETGYDVKWLNLALTLQQRQDQLFWDASAGRYATGSTLPEILRGLLSETDTATPSVNAVSAVNLLRLATLTGNSAWGSRPAMIFQSFGGRLRTAGALYPQLAAAYETSLIRPRIVVVTGDPRRKETYDALQAVQARWEPMREVIFLPNKGVARDRVTKALPFTAALAPDEKVPVTYVCAAGECHRE
jgi:uncharacterized protein YyaL (SSP411 family)